jgi:hypothetical protein
MNFLTPWQIHPAQWLLHSKKFVAVLCLFISFTTRGQDPFLNKLTISLDRYEAKEQKEKIYLQTDKAFYLAGEICWFKSYCVDATTQKPFSLSKVAYVELINAQGKPVLQGKIALEKGIGSGSFFLPPSLPSGAYTIRSYTNWMKNFGPEYFFGKNITIVNTLKIERDTAFAKAAGIDMQFFPEGGHLVDGIPCVVGFKATDETGMGVAVEGDIVGPDNKPLVHFQSQHLGMGRFTITPSSSVIYKAYVKTGGNRLTIANFPAVQSKGYALSVSSGSDSLLTISAFSNTEDSRPLYLVIHTRGVIKYTALLPLSAGQASLTLTKSILGEGVSSITLFNADQRAVSERLVFRMPRPLDLAAQSEMEEYGTRKKVSAHIRINSHLSDSTHASLGLSVYRVDSLQTEDDADIRAYLYLTSDIKGYIENPEYYFNHPGPSAETALDNLLLTQGWRRFAWDDIVRSGDPTFEYIPEWAGHIVTGHITDRVTGQPLENESVNLAGPAIKSQLANSLSNKQGLLLYDFPNLMGSNVLVMQNDNRTDTNYRLDISNPFSEKMADKPSLPFKLNPDFKNELSIYNVSSQVQNVFLLDNLMKFKTPLYRDSTYFYGQPDAKFFLDDYTRFNTMEEVLREYITGIAVRKRQGNFYIRVMDDPIKLFFDQDPLILLDGVPLTNADEVMDIDPLKIKKIEVVNREYFLGTLVASGIFALYSYNNDMAGVPLNSHALILEYDGLQLQREFYQPKYDVNSKAADRIPDFRNVLIWKPDIVIGKSGVADIDFYSSDMKGRYMGVVEGLDENGVAGTTRFYFDVP